LLSRSTQVNQAANSAVATALLKSLKPLTVLLLPLKLINHVKLIGT
jgi:hypothetical protein